MRRITLWLICTIAVLVLLFSYRTSLSGPTGPAAAHAPADPAGNAPGIVADPTTPAPTPSGTGAATPQTQAPSTKDTVANGTVAQTRWGPVQVRVRISGGRIVDVTTLQVPDGNGRDREINQYAVPQLREQVLAAQSADINGVSGATVTSDGYRESLQAALDSAHFRA
jgi:uncharacterized protein with FMN-binding domain